MFRNDDMLDIETLERVVAKIRNLFTTNVQVQTDYGFLYLHPGELRRLKRRRRICRLTGHMWELESYDSPTNTFHLKCARCFPHIDSRRAIVSYAPFKTVERKTD